MTKVVLASNAFRAGVRIAAGCLGALAGGASVRAQSFVTTINTAVVWQDNATDADRADGCLEAWQLLASATTMQRHTVSRDDALLIGATFASEAWSPYSGLDQLTAGPCVGWRHKFGLGAYAPAVRLDLAGAGIAARESARTGWQGQAALGFGQRFTEALRLDFGADLTRTDTHAAVFTRTTGGLAAEMSYDFMSRWRLKTRLGWRNGDVVSYSRAAWTYWGWQPANGYSYASTTPPLLVRTFDDPYLAYRTRAHTWSYTAGVSPAIGRNTALTFQIERAETSNATARYVNNLYSVGLAHQF